MTTTTTLPDYDQVAAELAETTLSVTASEYHGALCGYLCANDKPDVAGWVAAVVSGYGREDDMRLIRGHDDQRMVLARLFAATDEQLHDRSFGFQMLLPTGEDDLTERAAALAQWCDGFLFGLTASGVSDFSKLSEDVNELLRDFAAISQMQRLEDESEEDENAFAEIIEYVRMGTLLIHAELKQQLGRPSDVPMIH